MEFIFVAVVLVVLYTIGTMVSEAREERKEEVQRVLKERQQMWEVERRVKMEQVKGGDEE